MSNLTKPNKITVGGGLHSRIKQAEVLKEIAPQLDPQKLPNRLAIICDFSGSMDGRAAGRWDTDTYKSKLDLLKEAVQDFSLRSNPQDTAIAVESFPRGFRIDLTNDNQQIYLRMTQCKTIGDTPMGEGMRNAVQHHSPSRCMLISDGEATDGDASIEAARRYKEVELICDCVHIGESVGGEARLKMIAEITGGMYLKFKDVSSFSQNFHYLLPAARQELAGMLPYERAKLLGADDAK